MQNWKVRPNT